MDECVRSGLAMSVWNGLGDLFSGNFGGACVSDWAAIDTAVVTMEMASDRMPSLRSDDDRGRSTQDTVAAGDFD
jgi:hypothetical protein